MKKLNTTIYERTPKNEEHPFNVYDAKFWDLTNDEMLIMLAIFSNKTEKKDINDTLWVVNRVEIENRLCKGGMGWRNFRKAWDMLKIKKYINGIRKQGYVEWTIKEDPNLNNPIDTTKYVRPPVFRGPYSKKEKKEEVGSPIKEPNKFNPNLSEEEIKALGEKGEKVYRYNLEDYLKNKGNDKI